MSKFEEFKICTHGKSDENVECQKLLFELGYCWPNETCLVRSIYSWGLRVDKEGIIKCAPSKQAFKHFKVPLLLQEGLRTKVANSASGFSSDGANFFWDDTNHCSGLGTNSPSTRLQVSKGGSPESEPVSDKFLFKIKVEGRDHSQQIQTTLFKLGYRWRFSEEKDLIPLNCHRSVLVVEKGGVIKGADDTENFDLIPGQEMNLKDLHALLSWRMSKPRIKVWIGESSKKAKKVKDKLINLGYDFHSGGYFSSSHCTYIYTNKSGVICSSNRTSNASYIKLAGTGYCYFDLLKLGSFRYFLRTGATNDRSTKGKIYKCTYFSETNMAGKDDLGNHISIRWKNPNYWKEVSEEQYKDQDREIPAGEGFPIRDEEKIAVWDQETEVTVNPGFLSSLPEGSFSKSTFDQIQGMKTIEEKPMPKIEHSTGFYSNSDNNTIGIVKNGNLVAEIHVKDLEFTNDPMDILDLLNDIKRDLKTRLNQPKEETQMESNLKIEETILINNRRASEYSEEDLIEMIRCEENCIESLKKINTKTLTLDKRIKNHQNNLEKLSAILDSGEES